MNEVLELLLKVRAEGLDSLGQVDKSVQAISQSTTGASKEFEIFTKLLGIYSKAGLSTAEAFKEIARNSSGVIRDWAQQFTQAEKDFQKVQANAEKLAQQQSRLAEKQASAAAREAERTESDAARAVSAAERRAAAEERATERIVRTLERRAAVSSALNRTDQLNIERSSALQGISTPAASQRINTAYDSLIASTQRGEQARASALARREEEQAAKAAERAATLRSRAEERAAAQVERAAGSRMSAIERLGVVGSDYAGGLPLFLGRGALAAGVGGPIAAAGLGAAAVHIVHSGAEDAQQTTDLSKSLGLDLQQTQQLQAVLRLTHTEVTAFEGGMRSLSTALEDSAGRGKKAADGLTELGIPMVNNKGEARELGAVMLDVIDRLSGITDSSKRAYEAQVLLGRGAQEILPLIDNYKQAQEELRSFGIAFDDATIKKLTEAEHHFSAFGLVWDQFKLNLAEKLEPIVIPVIAKLTSILAGNAPQIDLGPKNAGDAVQRYQGRQLTPDQFKAPNLGLGISLTADPSFNRFLTGQGDKEEVLRKRVSDAKDSYENELKNADKFKSIGVDQSARDGERIKVSGLRSEYEKLNAELQLLIKNREALKSLEDRESKTASKDTVLSDPALLNFINEYAGGDKERFNSLYASFQSSPVIKAQQEREEYVSRFGFTGSLADRARATFDPQIQEGYLRENESAEKQGTDREEYTEKHFARDRGPNAQSLASALNLVAGLPEGTSVKDIDDGLKKFGEQIHKWVLGIGEANREVERINLEGARSGIEERSRRALRTTELQTQPGAQQGRAIEQAYRLRLDLANQLYDVEEQRIAREQDANKARVEQAQAELDYKKLVWQAEDEHQEKLLEQDRQRTEESRNFGGGLFDAITAKGSAGSSIGPFIQSQLKGVERTMFENVTAPIFKQAGAAMSGAIGGQTDANGQPTLIGKIFKGTPFESRGDADPVKSNTNATEDNTRETRALNSTIRSVATGQPGSASSATVPPGSSAAPLPGTGGGNSTLNWLAQAAGMGAIGASLGYTIGEMRRPQPIQIQDRLHFTPPDVNRSLGIAGGLSGFGAGTLMHFLQGGNGSAVAHGGTVSGSSGDSTVIADNTQKMSVSLDNIYNAITGNGTLDTSSGLPVSLAASSSGSSDALDGVFKYIAGGDASAASAASAPGSDSMDGIFNYIAGGSSKAAPSGSASRSSLSSTLGGFGVGAGAFAAEGGTALWQAVSGSPDLDTGPGKAVVATPANRAGVIAAGAATIYAGTEGVISGVKEGGARGITSAVGSGAAMAAALDPEPISKAVLTVLATGASILKGVFGDPKQERDTQISQMLQNQQYLAPATINRNVDTQGYNVAFDAQGRPTSTPFQGYSTTAPQSIYFNGGYYSIPGQVLQNGQTAPSTFGGGTPSIAPPSGPMPIAGNTPSQPSITIHVQALDTQNILDRSADIGSAVYHELQKGGPLASQIQTTILNG